MTHDRNYLRMLSDSELIRVAMDSDSDLALVLGDRLRDLLDVEEALEALKTEVVELNALLDNIAE